MNQSLSVGAVGVSGDHHVVQSAEDREQGIVGILACLQLIEINSRSPDDDPGCSWKATDCTPAGNSTFPDAK